MSGDEDMAKVWRRFATRLAVALMAGAVTFALVAVYFLSVQASQSEQIHQLQASQHTDTREAECRSRIASAAEVIRADRDSLGWQSLVDRIVAGSNEGLEERSAQIAELNRRLLTATDLRARATQICAEDPTFVPPT